MKLHSAVLLVEDLNKSKDFYTRFLGFTILHDFGNNVILDQGLSLWEIQPEHMISTNLKTKAVSNRFELYMEDENIETVFGVLEKAGINFLHKIHEEPWGQKTFRFFDPDKHLIEMGEPMETFVNNMYRNGLSVDEICKKSGMPAETVKALIKD